jgi:PHD/YefM family antitoxin component YafN of YafNO toxin-antitoxin module
MRQIAFRDFRLQGAKALGKLRPGEAVVLSNRQGPAYFLIPVEIEAMEAQEEELKTALALAAMRESWRRAEAAGIADLTMDEIDAEIATTRKETANSKKRRAS